MLQLIVFLSSIAPTHVVDRDLSTYHENLLNVDGQHQHEARHIIRNKKKLDTLGALLESIRQTVGLEFFIVISLLISNINLEVTTYSHRYIKIRNSH